MLLPVGRIAGEKGLLVEKELLPLLYPIPVEFITRYLTCLHKLLSFLGFPVVGDRPASYLF